MPTAFGKLLDALAGALGLSPDKSRRRPQAEPPRAAQTESHAEPKSEGGPVLRSAYGFPITADDCRVCGVRPAKPEHFNQFCSAECERDMGDRMDAWHDQFEERFGEGDTYEDWRAKIEAEHGKDYFVKLEERAREKD